MFDQEDFNIFHYQIYFGILHRRLSTLSVYSLIVMAGGKYPVAWY